MDPQLADKFAKLKAKSHCDSESLENNRINSNSPTDELNGNIYNEFRNFSTHEIDSFKSFFNKYDEDQDGYLGFEDLESVMKNKKIIHTRSELEQLIKEIDENHDNKISFKEFMRFAEKENQGNLIKKRNDDRENDDSVSVSEVGVKGIKSFFESKIAKIMKEVDTANEIQREKEIKKNLNGQYK